MMMMWACDQKNGSLGISVTLLTTMMGMQFSREAKTMTWYLRIGSSWGVGLEFGRISAQSVQQQLHSVHGKK